MFGFYLCRKNDDFLHIYFVMSDMYACVYANEQVFDGNMDSYQVKHAYLDEPIIGRYVKFHTVSWNRHPSMRVEIIGCQG